MPKERAPKLEEVYRQPFRILLLVGAAPRHCRGRRDDDLHGSTRTTEGQTSARVEGNIDRSPAAGASATAVYAATFGSVEETGRSWGHCARQAGWGLNSQIHAVGDGADWIRRQSQEVFREQGKLLCDFYHVSEYLARRRQRAGVTNPAPGAGHSRRDCGGAQCKQLQALEPHLNPTGQSMRKPQRNGYRYLNNRLDCLDYIRALKLGSAPLDRG